MRCVVLGGLYNVVMVNHLLSGFLELLCFITFFSFFLILLLSPSLDSFFLFGDGWVDGCPLSLYEIHIIYIPDRDTDLVGLID